MRPAPGRMLRPGPRNGRRRDRGDAPWIHRGGRRALRTPLPPRRRRHGDRRGRPPGPDHRGDDRFRRDVGGRRDIGGRPLRLPPRVRTGDPRHPRQRCVDRGPRRPQALLPDRARTRRLCGRPRLPSGDHRHRADLAGRPGRCLLALGPLRVGGGHGRGDRPRPDRERRGPSLRRTADRDRGRLRARPRARRFPFGGAGADLRRPERRGRHP